MVSHSCDTKIPFDISGNYAAMMEQYNSSFSPTFGTSESFCYKSEDKTHARDPTEGLDLFIIVILGLIGFLICIGTLIELSRDREKKDGVAMQLIKSFSLVSNTASLLATKSGSGHLDSMNGMK